MHPLASAHWALSTDSTRDPSLVYWTIVDLQYYVNVCCLTKWFSYIYTHILFHTLFHCGLSEDMEYSSLCYIVGPCLSILYAIIRKSKGTALTWPALPWSVETLSGWRARGEMEDGQRTSLFTIPPHAFILGENALFECNVDNAQYELPLVSPSSWHKLIFSNYVLAI